MDCRECKLTIADESLTICPVCGGPLQPGTDVAAASQEEEKVGDGDDVGEDGLDSYRKSVAEADDFSLAGLGLEPAPPKRKDDGNILGLADLWADNDLDAELEEMLADTFLSPSEKAESGTEALAEFSAMATALTESGKGGRSAEDRQKTLLGGAERFDDEPELKIVASAARFSGLRGYVLLLLLLVVGVAGGWFFFREKMTGLKGASLIDRPKPETAQGLNSRSESRVETVAASGAGKSES
ncbi:MAG: hypothetical protein JXR89_01670, partial [Deltaproteobacteria bacterium]|nr:hypothetical protein [Deltaproteobacteria bacterium]